MIDYVRLMVRLDEQDPRLFPLDAALEAFNQLEYMTRRLQIVQFVLSVLEPFDDCPIRIKAKKILHVIDEQRLLLRSQTDQEK